MKITVEQLKQLIREQVEEGLGPLPWEGYEESNKKAALKAANAIIADIEKIKDRLQDVFSEEEEWQALEALLDKVGKVVVKKQNTLTSDPMEKAVVMQWRGKRRR
jgi:phosphosulfolactate synthase (CoM biosynthesis protein A)